VLVQVFIDGQAVTVPDRVEGWVFKAGEHYTRVQAPAPEVSAPKEDPMANANAKGPEAAEAFLLLRGLALWGSTRRYLDKLLDQGAGADLRGPPATGRTTARALYYLMRGGLPTDPVERKAVLKAADQIRRMPQRATPVHPDGAPG
jgi:hypothetical protein